jgi:hypothetical protein
LRHLTFLGLVAILGCPKAPPRGEGEVGEVTVFGQIPSGPVALPPERERRLPRPQDFAFHFESKGKGPRYIRIELEADGRTSTLYEDRFGTPYEKNSLEYVLRLGNDDPDRVTLIVTVEAPHASSVVHRYPVELVGPERRFWEE